LDEQRNHDLELSQLDDDILQHINSTTEAIIDDFERVESTGSAVSSVHEFNCDYYQEPPDSPEDDLLENTDTEDGTEEVMDLIQFNMRLMSALDKQRATIARLRARIFRLSDLVKDLTIQLDIIRGNGIDRPPSDTTDTNALVLVDVNFGTSFLLQPNQDGDARSDPHYHPQLKQDLETQLAKINAIRRNSQEELWRYFDSGASRFVITETSPIRKRLQSVTSAYGSCSIGDGTPLQYIEKGQVKDNLEITVVRDLKYDLFSSVNAAKQGLTSVIDFDSLTGKNNSYTIDKATGAITPLVERGKGILELPLHLMLPDSACFTATPARILLSEALQPHVVLTFWHCYDDVTFDPTTRENNKTELTLFTFDIIKSLNERERDFLIHARLGHLATSEENLAND
jgi:hypothetical protein